MTARILGRIAFAAFIVGCVLLWHCPRCLADYDAKVKVKTPDGKEAVQFKLRGDDIKIEFHSGGEQKVLRLKTESRKKRKYELEGGEIAALVKAKDYGFKVFDTQERLLWKVKIYDDKIKISDNEENKNPYELKLGQDGLKVKGQVHIGKVNFYPEKPKVKVKDAWDREVFDSKTRRFSAMFGVLLLDKIPEAQRYIIMAEILLRGL
jgi:hypothetical protein